MLLETVDINAAAVASIARINGVPLNPTRGVLLPEELRQRACTELLRQAAVKAGFLHTNDTASDAAVISEAASAAIDAFLEHELQLPEPSEEACVRYYEAHAARYRTGERACIRHILFAVTPGTDVVALRKRAEACLLDVRCHDGNGGDVFRRSAAELSNCPSGADGGDLGWLAADNCVPEFAREVFAHVEVGVLPRLVHSRFGLHVVEVLKREAGEQRSYEAVQSAVRMAMRQQSYVTALRQCLKLLAAGAVIEGIDLDVADSPLVQ